MRISVCLYAGVVATGLAVAGLPTTATAEPVPPGGLVTSFLRNQGTYCSIICPLGAQTANTVVTTVQQAPGTLAAAWQVEDPARALGVTAASITGPTSVAAQRAIVADGTIVAPRALNAFEVGVVGLMNVGPAAAGGLPATAAAVETAREDTYAALNAPIVPDPPPLATPHDPVQAAVLGVIDVGSAVAFPAFNTVLTAAVQAPDAAAQELAATGDPAQALAAGADTVTAAKAAADTIIGDAVTNAMDLIAQANS
ncbi:hypothetical protein ACFXHA_04320 [Nocardia sp. NPDC059240]|uniref:hypothetical protein n=1 Tax=Nocardia sp. NPDC059240 TaxID=3346786 RepID=UPI0036BE0449